MPMHNGWLPREGFKADTVFKIIGKTALNPIFVLPFLLAAQFSKKGQNLSILHPLALFRVKTLFYLGLIRSINNYYSQGALNNWADDKYDWKKEIVLVTGGSGGIGGHIVRLLSEQGIKVVVLDIQPLSYEAPPEVYYFKCDITSPDEIAAVAKEIRSAVGHPTILINNAGVARGKNLLAASERDIRFTFDVNTFAHLWIVREFLPDMIAHDHGMVVTVASLAAWVAVPDMVDYAASKAAACAFHDGLTAELKTRYNAPKVRTVLVNQGYTKTSLFAGYHNDSPFLVPALEPETVAEGIVKQVLTGKSGQVIMPKFGASVTALAAMPHWYQNHMRSKGANIMPNFRGRQVVTDLDKFYADKEKAETEESTVLVPEAK